MNVDPKTRVFRSPGDYHKYASDRWRKDKVGVRAVVLKEGGSGWYWSLHEPKLSQVYSTRLSISSNELERGGPVESYETARAAGVAAAKRMGWS